MTKWMKAVAAAAAIAVMPAMAAAQEIEAEKRENVTNYRILMFNVKPGKGEEWRERWDMIVATSKELGQPTPILHHMMVGEYGNMVMVPLVEGMAALDWETTPSGAAFDNAMAAKLGGVEAFREWQAGWPEITTRPKVSYSHVHHD